MTDHYEVFLSYSRNDLEAATNLLGQLERHGLAVFRDQKRIRAGDLWLKRVQEAVDACGSFVVLVGRDGVRRWIGAETQAALNRYFGPHDDALRLPIFPILLGDTSLETLPAFLQLFQGTSWNGADALPESLLEQIRERAIVPNDAIAFEGCPFVGLDAFRPDQAQLFFGRQKETLDALACFDTRAGSPTVRWLEINGNSGAGKSSLMNAGLLPLVDQGWLWPRTGFEHWRRIGPMMPSERPVEMLAEHLTRAFKSNEPSLEMADVRKRLEPEKPEKFDERALADWLRGRKLDDETAFLLAIDQFEELFTFADPAERDRFDRLLATALEDADCPLFVISTVRADFLDRFDDLPQLTEVRNRAGKQWTLPLISGDALREIISGPARLAGLDVSEVQEFMVREAQDELGAVPLIENALQWLWVQRTPDGRLSGRLLTERGGLAGILSEGADGLLASLDKQRAGALELLFRLIKVDPEGRRHSRQRISFAEAVAVAGGGDAGRAVIDRLTGTRARDDPRATGPLRLITVTGEGGATARDGEGWVDLIHDTLIRSKGVDAEGQPQPYWPTLWRYIEQHKDRAARRERLQLLAREWKDRTGLARLFGLAGWSAFLRYRGLGAPGSPEARYLRWSRGSALVQAALLAMVLAPVVEGLYWAGSRELPMEMLVKRWAYLLFRELPLPDLVEIPAGSFMMGSEQQSDEQPIRRVTFAAAFHLASTEVTFEQWEACVADGHCRGFRPYDEKWGRGKRPVIHVSWHDAQLYVAWLSRKREQTCRLPSEAEWEYACRAGTTTEYALPAETAGSDDIAGKGSANCDDCGSEWGHRQTAPVGSFPANAWGLHDMHGNVWEWIEDCWHRDYQDAPEDEDGRDCTSRVLRGGSWFNLQVDARCANRDKFSPDEQFDNVGFRVVCSSPSSIVDLKDGMQPFAISPATASDPAKFRPR